MNETDNEQKLASEFMVNTKFYCICEFNQAFLLAAFNIKNKYKSHSGTNFA